MNKETKDSGGMMSAWTLTVCGACLLLFAAIHRLQLHTGSYTKSLLIPVEFFLLLGVAGLVAVYLLYAVVLLIKRQWKELLIILINALLGIGSVIGAVAIDSPTLLYMT